MNDENGLFTHLRAMHTAIQQTESRADRVQWADLRRLLPFIRGHWSRTLVAVITMLMASLLSLPGPLLIRYIVDDVLVSRDTQQLGLVILLLAGLQTARLVCSFAASYSFSVLNQKVVISIKQTLFRHLLHLPLSFFDRAQSGYLMARLGEVQRMGLLFSGSLITLAIGFIEFGLSLVMMIILNWRLTILALLLLPLAYQLTRRSSRGLRVTSREVYEKEAEVTRQVQEILSGVRTVKLFATEEQEAQKVERSLSQFLRSAITQSVVSSLTNELVAFSAILTGFAVLGLGSIEIIAGRFTLGSYMAFAAYMSKVYMPVQLSASIGLTLQPGLVALRRVLNLFDLIAEEKPPAKQKVLSLSGEIAFEHVWFSYDGHTPVLRDVTFRIRPGERVATIGPSGAGKTTIAQLLLGLYRPQQGHICFDGQALDTLSPARLRERIGVVSQEIFLFNDTIRNNIRYSQPEASEASIIHAAQLADADEFIRQLPAGYDSRVGEDGVILSAGQRQRLSIARAILKDPDIVILDEATSQLDQESEQRICHALVQAFAGKTLLVIAHRLSTVLALAVDRVFEIREGCLIEVKLPRSNRARMSSFVMGTKLPQTEVTE